MPPWIDRCPEGHASLEHRQTGYHCGPCGQTYPGEPYDARHTEFPVEDEPGATGQSMAREKFGVLADLVQATEPETRTAVKARKLDGDPSVVGRILANLEDAGLVASDSRPTTNWWRPTPEGRRFGGASGPSAKASQEVATDD
jgi:hypothetical protein